MYGHTLCSDCITDLKSCFICQLEIKILNQDLFDLLNQDLLSQKEVFHQIHHRRPLHLIAYVC